MTMPRIRSLLLAGAAAASVIGLAAGPASAAPVAGGAAPEASGATVCRTFNLLGLYSGMVEAERFIQCNGGDPGPLNTTLQRKDPVTGVFVTLDSGLGAAGYICKGTALRTYRLKEATSVVKTFNCS